MRLAPFPSLIALACCAYAGCSVINAPDDVVAQGSGGNGATGATAPGAGRAGDEPVGGEVGSGKGGDGSGLGGDVGSGLGGDVGTGGEGALVGPDPTTGLLVLGAEDEATKKRQLLVLAARNGAELAREALPVAAVAYDEAPGRHLWFVFTAGAFPAQTTGAADLEIRRFNDATNKWTTVGKATALPPPEPDQLVVLNERLAYLSHRVVSGKTVSALTLLDTSDPEHVTEVTSRTAATGESYVGLVGERGSEVDAEAPGGRVHLMISQDCTADCELFAQHIFVGASLTDGTSLSIDRFVGQPRFAKTKLDNRLYVAESSTSLAALAIRSYKGSELTSPTVFTLTGFVGDDVGGFTLAECANGGVVTDADGSQLIAFHLTSGQPQLQALGHTGGPVYTEPFAPSVITLDPALAPGLRSFEVSKSGTTKVAVNERSAWQPVTDLLPLTGATRRGEVFACP